MPARLYSNPSIHLQGDKNMKVRPDIVGLKRVCPMPTLMRRIGLGDYATTSCQSPFRKDAAPSFGIFQAPSGDWLFKDHATGQTGDELHLLALYLGRDANSDFQYLLEQYAFYAGQSREADGHAGGPAKQVTTSKPAVDLTNYRAGGADEIRELANARPYYREGLNWASGRGVLNFGEIGGNPVYVVTDCTKKLAEARRIHGKTFHQGNKSHCLKGSSKSWPIGILEAKSYPNIALVEGVPDFLHAHAAILHEQSNHYASTDVSCAPVAMLGASCNIAEEALEHFNGKHVTLFPHVDQAGKEAAQRWGDQLYHAGVQDILVFELDGAITEQRKPVNDLYDTYCLSTESLKANPSLRRMFHA